MSHKNILITGAGGFVGSYLIKELRQDPNNLIFGSVYKAISDISALLPQEQIIEGDLTDFSYCEDLVKKSNPQVVFHLAALSVVGDSHQKTTTIINSNTNISFNILEAIRLHAPSAKIIAVCSANGYGAVQNYSAPITEDTQLRPLNPYAVSKITQEMLALQYHLAYDLNTIILRPFNHTGPGQTNEFVIPKLAEQFAKIKRGEAKPEIQIGNLDSVRDFTDVRDMVHAYNLASQNCASGEIYNIGSGVGVSVKDLISIFEDITKVKVELIQNPDLVRSADVPSLIADSTKFKSQTAYAPKIPLRQTISDILDSYSTEKG